MCDGNVRNSMTECHSGVWTSESLYYHDSQWGVRRAVYCVQ